MRHGQKFNHLSRKSAHRKAMLSNMGTSLVIHKRIRTTVAKAKALRKFIEPVLTRAKEDTTHARRVAFKYLRDKEAVKELFGEVAEKIASRPGGYTRILRTGIRYGDNAEMCIIELVDYNDNIVSETKSTGAKQKRSRRGGGKKSDAGDTTAKAAAPKEDKPKKEEAPTEEPKAEAAPEEPAAEVVEETPAEEAPADEPKAEAEEPAADEPAADEAEESGDDKDKKE